MKMTNEFKEKLYQRIDEKTGILSHPTSEFETINASVNGIPKHLWTQWRADCSHFFNDIFWAKMWNDHVKAQAYELLMSNAQQPQQEAAPRQEKEQRIPMMGDPYQLEGENDGK